MFNFSKKPKPYNRVMYRHGDLLIRRVSGLPNNVIGIPGKIIAEGEVSGHKHKLNGPVLILAPKEQVPNNSYLKPPINEFSQVYFDAKDDIKLTHEEHKTLEIPSGIYKVTREREYNPFDELQVEVLD